MRLAVSQVNVSGSSGVIGIDSKWFTFREQNAYAATDFVERTQPANVRGVARRPSWALDKRLIHTRLYGVGAWTHNILIDEHLRMMPQSPPPPTDVPQVAAGGGPGVTAESICYLQWYDSLGARQTALSWGTPVSLANQTRVWSSLPTDAPPGMDSIRGVVADDGLLPRVAWTRQVGVTSVTEAVDTLALGEAVPGWTRLPLCTMNVVYHDSQYASGNREFPERVFKTALGELERYEGVFVQTDGEAVVGLIVSNDNLIFGSYERIYRATGITEFDITRKIEKPDIGLLSHHAHDYAHGRAIIPTNWGIYLYNGTWIPILGKRDDEWRRHYEAFREDFEAAQGFYDPVENVFIFGPVPHLDTEFNNLWVDWVLKCKNLFPETADEPFRPDWAIDVRARKTASRASFFIPGSGSRYVVSGGCDGIMRRENQLSDNSDDGDTYAKAMIWEPASLQPDPQGFAADSFRFTKLFLGLQNRAGIVTVKAFAGTEAAHRHLTPNWTLPIPASQHSWTPPGGGLDVEALPIEWSAFPLVRCAGDTLHLRFEALTPSSNDSSDPDRVRFNGWGTLALPGQRTRGAYVEIDEQ